MRVTRTFQQVLLAHRLPDHLDEETRAFAALANISVSELPSPIDGRSFAVFDLRWSISQSHAYARAGEFIVLDNGVQIVPETEFELHYRKEEPVAL